jgi:cystathionine gamma-synthase
MAAVADDKMAGLGLPSSEPIVLASWFTSAGVPDPGGYHYGRNENPTWEALERHLGALERADALVFASGMGAALPLLLALADRATRVLVTRDCYYNVRRLLELLAPRGIAGVTVDLADADAVERELSRGPAIVWAESPTNPMLRVFDLRRLAELAGAHGGVLVADNTTATSALQQPLDLGATACLTSLTKATSGHSDIVLGAVTTRDGELLERLRAWRTVGGAIPGPFEAWLALRGVRTLPLRIRRQSDTALRVAGWLRERPDVTAVHYPGLRPGPLLDAQMPHGCGPLLSFEIAGDAGRADALVAAARTIRPATSFGGVDSVWERRARWPNEDAPPTLIRLSVGIEEPEDVIEDLARAFDAIAG